MQLILAIDSDPRRTEQLASLVRARLRVDLVQATSAGEGLHALKDRVPDLILTSPLLSPFDDGVLDEYLRDLGAAGAHVQTVRIPLLSAPPSKRALTDRLFMRGRTKPTSPAAPDGCDPTVFADEIAVYLSRAASARESVAHLSRALAPRQDEEQPSPAAESPVDARPAATDYWTRMNEACVEEFTEALQQADAAAVDWQAREAAQPADEMMSAPMPVEAPESPYIQEPVSAATAIGDPVRDAEQAPQQPTRPDKSSTFEAALAAIRAAWVKPEASTSIASPPTEAATPRAAAPGTTDLSDQQHPRHEMATPEPRLRQDKWGVFDPDGDGFSASAETLDQVPESKDAQPRASVASRVISIR